MDNFKLSALAGRIFSSVIFGYWGGYDKMNIKWKIACYKHVLGTITIHNSLVTLCAWFQSEKYWWSCFGDNRNGKIFTLDLSVKAWCLYYGLAVVFEVVKRICIFERPLWNSTCIILYLSAVRILSDINKDEFPFCSMLSTNMPVT